MINKGSSQLPKIIGACAIFSASILMSIQGHGFAGGLGTFYGDTLQWGFEQALADAGFAEWVDLTHNREPFYIPQAASHAITTTRDQSISFALSAKHIQEPVEPPEALQTLTFEILQGPINGTVSGDLPNITYHPNSGFTGYDKIVFRVLDGVDGGTTGTIDVKVSGSYTLFEAGQVRPLALNSSADRLYALNTPDQRLEVFDVSTDTPTLITSVRVGIEPVAIALRNDNEAWVVNTLSDNISIVDLSDDDPVVVNTLQVGDEPQDIVFAGSNRDRAFVTTAHRGQHSPSDLAPMTPGIGRADVWVFDSHNLASGKPETIVTLFGMEPRALAASQDGSKVYAAIFKSGNQTAIATHNYRLFGDNSTKYGKKSTITDAEGVRAPNTGLVVKYDGEDWRDVFGTKWNSAIYFDLPDYDVFTIDALATTPKVVEKIPHVGTSLFNMTVNPSNGDVYVSNMDARNHLLFEGAGERSNIQTLRGRFMDNRITVIQDGTVLPRTLNPHLSDARPTGSPEENALSLAMPLEMAVSNDGDTLYVSAFGSASLGVIDTSALTNNSHSASQERLIPLSAGGPTGVVLDEANDRLFTLTRFDNGISVIDTDTHTEISHINMYNPEPDFVVEGRPFLYDARFSSGRGDTACGSCHLFGDKDNLGWDLGDPDHSWSENPRRYVNKIIERNALRVHHPLKGPMVTQSLRGMEFQGPLHWRGDRTGAKRFNGESLEHAAFKEFSGAFVGLLGRANEPTEEEMNAFADFALQLRYPPSAVRELNDQLTPAQTDGADTYFNMKTTGFPAPETGNVAMMTCNDCHQVDPAIERFGTTTEMSFEGTEVSQDMKIAHLRTTYTKIGMFGQYFREQTSTARQMGDQVLGFGYAHDGAADTLENFLSLNVFHVPDDKLNNLIDYVMAIPTGFAPMVGQQVTLNTTSPTENLALLATMYEQAMLHVTDQTVAKPQCDMIVSGRIASSSVGLVLAGNGHFYSDLADSSNNDSLTLDNLIQLSGIEGNQITFSCVPAGSALRIALDRDEDGILDSEDTLLMGRADTSIMPALPDADPEEDVMVDSFDGFFLREQIMKSTGTYPNFNEF